MRRYASEVVVFALLASCATYDELGPLPSAGVDSTSGSPNSAEGGAFNGGSAGASVASSGGAGAATGGVGSSSGASPTAGNGGSSSAGTASGGSAGRAPSGGAAGGLSASGAGQGGDAVTDACPEDPSKTAPGTCGCGMPDVDTAQLASCVGLKNALAHRYDFEGAGAAVLDRSPSWTARGCSTSAEARAGRTSTCRTA